MNVSNAAKYNRKIEIYSIVRTKDEDGFPVDTPTVFFAPWASVKTTKGFTLIANASSFEKAYTNFTMRYSETAALINRDMWIMFKGKKYTIEYINNIDEANVEIEIQAKEVTK